MSPHDLSIPPLIYYRHDPSILAQSCPLETFERTASNERSNLLLSVTLDIPMYTFELCAYQLGVLRPSGVIFSDLNMIIMLIMMVVVKVMVISISDTSMRMPCMGCRTQ